MANPLNITVRFEGTDAGVEALARRIIASLKQMEQSQGQLNIAQQTGTSVANALTRQVLELAAAFEAGRALTDFVRAGIRFNEVMQTSALGIATLVTAQSQLFDVNGRLVTGQQALTRALALSNEQLTKLRIAGIQTAATTAQLVDAYQQAVGAGLSAGLNLDQIRILTTQVVQAAGALGVPMNQLNQEIRSILEGTIDRNSRVAKALRITNAEIRAAAKSGDLFDTLFKRFEAFTVAGPKIAATFQAMKSNLAESVQTLSGLGSKGLFDTITELGNKAVAQIFNFKSGKVTEQFEPLVKTLDDILSRIGNLSGGILAGVIEGAKNFGQAWAANRERIDEVLDDLGDIATQVIRIVVSIGRAAGATIQWLIQSRAIHVVLALIEGVLQFIADHIKVIAFVLGGFALRAGISALATVPAILALIAANPVTAAVIGLIALGGAFTAVTESAKKAAEKQTQAEEATKRAQATNAGLAREYAAVTKALEDKRLKTDEVKLLQERQKQLEEELKKSGEDYATILNQQGKASRDLAKDMDALTKKRLDEKTAALAQAQAVLEAAKANAKGPNIKDLTDKGDIQGLVNRKTGLPSVAEAQARLNKARADLLAFNVAVVNGAQDADNLVTTVVSANRFAALNAKDALDRLKGLTEATIKNIKEGLSTETALLQNRRAQELITEREFLNQVLVLNAKAIAAQIAAKQKLLAATTDPGDQEKIKGDIQALNQDLIQLALKNQADLITINKNAIKTSRGLVVQEFKNAGQDLAAAAFESGEKYMDALNAAIDAGDEALRNRIQKLIQEDVTSAFRQKLEEEAARAQSKLQDALTRIQVLQQTGAIGSGTAFKLQTAAYKEAIGVLTHLADTLQTVAVTPEQIDSVRALRTAIAQLEGELTAGEFTMRAFGEHVAQIFADNLGPAIKGAFDSIFDNTKKASEAFREMALAIIDAISSIITKLIAIKIVEAITGVHLQGVFAEGGYTGPGAKYEPAGVVHRGEYVLNAKATSEIGTARLDYANRFGKLPTFAEGGMVADAIANFNNQSVRSPDPASFNPVAVSKAMAAQAAQVSLEGFLELGLSEGLIVQHMDANFVKLAKKHRNGLRTVIPDRR